MKCGIYGIKNLIDGKWYIGQSTNMGKRIKNHVFACKGKYHRNSHFQNSFNKYGADNFEFRILEETEEGLLDIQERLWIKHYKSDQSEYGYNLESGGHQLKHLSLETRQKMSEVRKGANSPLFGKHRSAETIRKMSESNKGRRNSEETRRKISEANKGRIFSEETRLKISKSNIGKHNGPLSFEHRQKLSAAGMGHKAWNKGKKMYFSLEALKKIGEASKGNQYRKGLTPWNIGKQMSAETKEKLSKACSGGHLSEEHKRKIGEANKGKTSWNKGGKCSLETRKKISMARQECLRKIRESKNE